MNQRQAILYGNQLAREGRVDTKHAPFGEHVCRIPESDWHALCTLFPSLNAQDHAERQAALERFHASPASEPYRVRRPSR